MDATDVRELLGQAADMRQQLFGVDTEGNPQLARYDESAGPASDFLCYFTPVRTQQQLDEVGFKDVHDSIVRFDKDVGFVPQLGKTIRLLNASPARTDILLTLKEFGQSPVNPEYVIGCKAVF